MLEIHKEWGRQRFKNDSPLAVSVIQIFSTSATDGLDGASVEDQTGGFTQRESGDAEL